MDILLTGLSLLDFDSMNKVTPKPNLWISRKSLCLLEFVDEVKHLQFLDEHILTNGVPFVRTDSIILNITGDMSSIFQVYTTGGKFEINRNKNATVITSIL